MPHIGPKNSVSITKNVGFLLTIYMIEQLSLISILKLGSILYIKHSFSEMIVTILICTIYDVLSNIGYVTPMPTLPSSVCFDFVKTRVTRNFID